MKYAKHLKQKNKLPGGSNFKEGIMYKLTINGTITIMLNTFHECTAYAKVFIEQGYTVEVSKV